MIYRLLDDEPTLFPDPTQADPSGIVAVGGDLSPQRLVSAYASGIFPWYDPQSPLLWWSPDPRCTLLPHAFHVPHSLRRQLNRQRNWQLDWQRNSSPQGFSQKLPQKTPNLPAPFTLTIDTAFDRVIRQCASMPRAGQNGTWIMPEMIDAYQRLHDLGVAHSIEVWEKEHLVGGLYGVGLGKAFFGESMFHTRPYASKIALVRLVQTLWNHDYTLVDCQISTPHVIALGAQLVPRVAFLQLVQEAVAKPHPFPALLD